MFELTQKFRRLFLVVPMFMTVILAGGLVPSVSGQSRQDRQLVARAESITQDRFPVRTFSPRGVRVYARSRPLPEVLRAVDEGFANLFAIARRSGYRSRLDYSSYTVFIARADRAKDSTGAYSPDIAVPAGQYAGSGYDQGGFVFAAGMVVAFTPAALIIAEHQGNLQRVSEVVRYEGEHIVLYHNDRALYSRTADHSQSGGHPILK